MSLTITECIQQLLAGTVLSTLCVNYFILKNRETQSEVERENNHLVWPLNSIPRLPKAKLPNPVTSTMCEHLHTSAPCLLQL